MHNAKLYMENRGLSTKNGGIPFGVVLQRGYIQHFEFCIYSTVVVTSLTVFAMVENTL